MRRRIAVLLVARCLAAMLLAAGCVLDVEEWEWDEDDVGSSQHALSINQPGYVTESSVHALANRCAVNPEGDIASGLIIDPGYIMAYRSGYHSPPDLCDPAQTTETCGSSVPAPVYPESIESTDYHRQSIQRIRRNTKNYLLVSHSVQADHLTCWDAGFEVIEMGVAAHGSGSLNLGSGGVTPTSAALCADHIVKYQEYSSPIRRHAGGMQVNGSYVVVPFEDTDGRTVPASFRTFNVSDPPNSFSGPTVLRERGDDTYGAATALTRTNDGKFMVMIFGNDGADSEVFVSTGNTMPTVPTDWDSKAVVDFLSNANIQNVQFVTKCSGVAGDVSGLLYVVATHKNAPPLNEDWVYLYRVTFPDPSTYVPAFEFRASRRMVCSSANTGGTRYCDFDAGAGVYVDGNGRLMLYGVEHWNDHNDGFLIDHGVKVREFSTH